MLAFIRTLLSGDGVLSPAEFQARRQPGDVLLDVRTPAEYAAGHLDGADNLDVMAPDFAARIDTLDREQTYYLYGRGRSGPAARTLREVGFAQVYDLGDFDTLATAGLPILCDAYALV